MKTIKLILTFSFIGLTVNILSAQHSLIPKKPSLNRNSESVIIIPVGTSANAFGWGFSGGQMTYLWAEPSLNTIVNIHRMGGILDPEGFSGDIGYDISTDRGETWQNQTEIYTAPNSGGTLTGSVIPQCAVFNPPGNIHPDEAYIPFFSHLHTSGADHLLVQGRGKTGDSDDTTAYYLTSPFSPYLITKTSGYTITTEGDIWAAGILMDTAYGGYYYAGYLGIFHGIWNEESLDFEFTTSLLPCETFKNFLPQDVKVAFAPDGITGWIGVIADNGTIPISTCESYFPILFKTEDAGATWQGPFTAAIAGPDGLMDIQNYFTDSELQQLYGLPLPPRDVIEFTTAYDFDLHVDYAGNPHIAVVVGITDIDMYTIVTQPYQGYPNHDMLYMLATDIYLDNNEWKVHILGRLQNFRGSYGSEIYEDNRIQIASTSDGLYMFVSWLDTDIPGYYENNKPNIFCRGISCIDQRITCPNGEDRPYNITAYTEGMWQAYCHSMSHYVFEEGGGDLFTIPLVYQSFSEPQDPTLPVQFRYIRDFTISSYDFLVGSDEHTFPAGTFSVLQCTPNPCTTKVTLEIEVIKAQKINFIINDLTGLIVLSYPPLACKQGRNATELDISGLAAGVYLIFIEGEDGKVVRKIMVDL